MLVLTVVIVMFIWWWTCFVALKFLERKIASTKIEVHRSNDSSKRMNTRTFTLRSLLHGTALSHLRTWSVKVAEAIKIYSIQRHVFSLLFSIYNEDNHLNLSHSLNNTNNVHTEVRSYCAVFRDIFGKAEALSEPRSVHSFDPKKITQTKSHSRTANHTHNNTVWGGLCSAHQHQPHTAQYQSHTTPVSYHTNTVNLC